MRQEGYRIQASADFATNKFGIFRLHVISGSFGEHVVLTRGVTAGDKGVLCRIASKCLTSSVFDSADCDCAAQMRLAMRELSHAEKGNLIYLDREGRGHGLATKVQAMNW